MLLTALLCAALAQDAGVPPAALPAQAPRGLETGSPTAHAGAPGMGPLTRHLAEAGQRGAWAYAHTPRGFVVTGRDPDSLDYAFTREGTGADRTVSMRVTVSPGEGFAGILLGFEPGGPSYHAFTVGADGVVSVWRRDEGGFRPVIQSRTGALHAGENALAVIERGDAVRFLLNGEQVAEIESRGLGEGGVGYLAGGRVEAALSGFTVGTR